MKDYLEEAYKTEKKFVEKTSIEVLLKGIKGPKFIDAGIIPAPNYEEIRAKKK